MPTYEYECEKCGLLFEEYQSISDQPISKCKKPDCDGHVKRLISSGAGFLFKGSGFYSTDYRSDSYKKKASAESGPTVPKAGESKSSGPPAAAPPTT
jgi:putative FmdB family regulatory protein